jgi:magnesium transporter
MIEAVVYRDGVRTEDRVDPGSYGTYMGRRSVFLWLDVADPTEEDLGVLAATFDLHPLVIEDTRHRRQRPKVELFKGYSFIVLRAARLQSSETNPADLDESEVHAFAGDGFLATLRFSPAFDMTAAVARWESQPQMLALGPGWAVYTLVDQVVDRYLGAVEAYEDLTDNLEDDVFAKEDGQGEDPSVRERLFQLKRETVRLRRFVSPLREGVGLLLDRPELAPTALEPYYRDVVDHVIRIDELLDNVRDLLTSLQELRIAQAANRMNEVMKSLTAWATILLVPTLFAGIWGMNFERMPELAWRYGYLLAIATIVGSAFGLYAWFKWKKRWL